MVLKGSLALLAVDWRGSGFAAVGLLSKPTQSIHTQRSTPPLFGIPPNIAEALCKAQERDRSETPVVARNPFSLSNFRVLNF